MLEVETPILSADTVVDRHFDPFCVLPHGGDGGVPGPFWLQTSPEFGMKRLLAAGAVDLSNHPGVSPGRMRPVAQSRIHHGGVVSPGRDHGRRNPVPGPALRSDAPPRAGRGPQLRRGLPALAGNRSARVPSRQLAEVGAERRPAPPESLAADDRDGWLDFLLVERIQPQLGCTGVRRSCYDFPPARLPWPACGPGRRPWPSGSSSTWTGSSWPTATTKCSTRKSCAAAGRGQRPAALATASRPCPNKIGCWRRWRPDCRPRPAWPWGSTGW